jgi:hypothetical protein
MPALLRPSARHATRRRRRLRRADNLALRHGRYSAVQRGGYFWQAKAGRCGRSASVRPCCRRLTIGVRKTNGWRTATKREQFTCLAAACVGRNGEDFHTADEIPLTPVSAAGRAANRFACLVPRRRESLTATSTVRALYVNLVASSQRECVFIASSSISPQTFRSAIQRLGGRPVTP